jgi:hypothetical protein
MGPTTQVLVTFFKSTIYAFLSAAQGVNEIVMSTMAIMMITDFATVGHACKRRTLAALQGRQGVCSSGWF